jgi:uncharacterized protein YjbI with pentapeptide repeats
MTPPDDNQRPTPGSGDGFKAPEALITGMFLGPLAVALLALVLSKTGLEWTWEYWGSSNGTFDRSVIFRNFGLLTLALIALPLAVWRSWTAHKQARSANRQTELAEKGLIIDRYQKGAQMLESSELSVRLAGIYALRELVWSDPAETYFLVLDLLYDFVRERSNDRKPCLDTVSHARPDPGYGIFPPDLQKAIETASRLRNSVPNGVEEEIRKSWFADLTGANLTDAVLENANLKRARLTAAQLTRAEMTGIDLTNADLVGADLRRAILEGAVLREVDFGGANLSEADLSNANLKDADLFEAIFFAAELNGAKLDGACCIATIFDSASLLDTEMQKTLFHLSSLLDANLSGADLEGAQLVSSKLTGANLSSANLIRVNFEGADLSGADLSNAILTGANLCGANLEDAVLTGAEMTKATLTEQATSDVDT